MKKLIRILSPLAVVFLASCSGNTSVIFPTASVLLITSTPVPTEVPTIIPTQIVPSPESTLAPSSTSTPSLTTDIAWSQEIPPRFVEGIENRYVADLSWSPSDDEYVYMRCLDDKLNIFIAKAPDFAPHSLASVKSCMGDVYLPGVTWSPDGNYILFWGPTDKQRNDAWVIRRDGSDLHPLTVKDTLLNPVFSYWLDDHTVLYENYSGGGHVQVTALNFLTGEFDRIAMAHGDVGVPKDGYIPVQNSISIDDYHLFLISRKFPERGQENDTSLMTGRFVDFSALDTSPITETMTSFQGWQPGTYNALVSWSKRTSMYPGSPIQKQSLLLWDITNGTTSIIAPGAFHGEFSSDGRYLAYSIFDPKKFLTVSSVFYDNGSQILMNVDPGIDDPQVLFDQIYLQLMALPDREVLFSIPNRSSSFSPDGRCLSFISKGQIRTNAQNWPVAIREGTEQTTYLHLLDLRTRQLSASLPDVAAILGWSPDSSKILYQDNIGNVLLYQMTTRATVPVINQLLDREIEQVKWSHDGTYLLLAVGDPGKKDLSVAIIDLP